MVKNFLIPKSIALMSILAACGSSSDGGSQKDEKKNQSEDDPNGNPAAIIIPKDATFNAVDFATGPNLECKGSIGDVLFNAQKVLACCIKLDMNLIAEKKVRFVQESGGNLIVKPEQCKVAFITGEVKTTRAVHIDLSNVSHVRFGSTKIFEQVAGNVSLQGQKSASPEVRTSIVGPKAPLWVPGHTSLNNLHIASNDLQYKLHNGANSFAASNVLLEGGTFYAEAGVGFSSSIEQTISNFTIRSSNRPVEMINYVFDTRALKIEKGTSAHDPHIWLRGMISGSSVTVAENRFPIVTGVSLGKGISVTLNPGVMIKTQVRKQIGLAEENTSTNESTQAFAIRSDVATLISNGTAEQPVTFTTYYDDSVGGDTNGDGSATEVKQARNHAISLIFAPNSKVLMQHTKFKQVGIWLYNSNDSSFDLKNFSMEMAGFPTHAIYLKHSAKIDFTGPASINGTFHFATAADNRFALKLGTYDSDDMMVSGLANLTVSGFSSSLAAAKSIFVPYKANCKQGFAGRVMYMNSSTPKTCE